MFLETLALCFLFALSRQQTCPSYEAGSIGTPGSRRNPQTNRVYINTDDRVSCAGIVYGWKFCSYRNSADAHVQISMYRDIEEEGGGYQLVNGSVYLLTVDENIDSYTCLDRFLDHHEYFTVEQGDMIASCWNDANGIEMLSISRNSLATGGECSQGIIDETSRNNYKKLLLSAYINVDECIQGAHRCHQNATCSDLVGAEDSYNCTCNTGHTGDGFLCVVDSNEGETDDSKNGTNCTTNSGSCVAEDDSKATGNNDGGVDIGTVTAIVITLLLLLLAVITVVMLLGFFLQRKRSQQKQLALDVTNIGNELYLKHNEVSYNDTTVAVAYEVPLDSLQKECTYELETSELTYEPSTEGNIYETPDALGGHEASFYELPSEYAAIYEQAVSGGNNECASPYECPAKDESSLYEQIRSYHSKVIIRKDIQFISHLGSGQFGSVSKAELRTKSGKQDVAVKTLTDSANTVKFLQEAAIMAQFKHPNILTLHGVVSVGDPKMIVVELMCNGDLKECVTNMRPDPGQLVSDSVPKQLLNFSKQVALGLHYLSLRGFIHRDLAARNVLVSNMLCKIADFGMSRDLANDDIYVSHGGMIPVRWTAPEAINQKRYSTASDVWSYGCVLYEIWSLGHKPFEAVQVKQVPQLVRSGYRLPPPPGCPKKIYQLMIDTWHPDVSSRPEPRDVLRALIGNVDEVMEIPTENVPVGSQAAVLGAPLNTATHLYTQLQNSYK